MFNTLFANYKFRINSVFTFSKTMTALASWPILYILKIFNFCLKHADKIVFNDKKTRKWDQKLVATVNNVMLVPVSNQFPFKRSYAYH